jgi:hypothetical protein
MLEWFEISLETWVYVNFLLQLQGKLEVYVTTFSNNDGNLSSIGLFRGQSNTKCASFSIAS